MESKRLQLKLQLRLAYIGTSISRLGLSPKKYDHLGQRYSYFNIVLRLFNRIGTS